MDVEKTGRKQFSIGIDVHLSFGNPVAFIDLDNTTLVNTHTRPEPGRSCSVNNLGVSEDNIKAHRISYLLSFSEHPIFVFHIVRIYSCNLLRIARNRF